MIVDNWFLGMSILTLGFLKVMFGEDVSNGIEEGLTTEMILTVISTLSMIICLALYKKIFKESIQDTCHRWFGAKRNRTKLDLQNDLEELQKELNELKDKDKL